MGEELLRPPDDMFFIYIGVSLALVLLGGLMSGLTVGLFSIDELKLKLLQWDEDATEEDRRNARKVEPLLHRHHLLLCTLLVANAAAMEALPLFLDDLVPTWLAIVLSVTFVLAFGEILPQALCTKNPLKVGARLAIVVRFFMLLLLPICWPLSKLLDWMFGSDHKTVLMRRSELQALVNVHGDKEGSDGYLSEDEVTLLQGALKLKYKTVSGFMTPINEVFMLDADSILDADLMAEIVHRGHSRIPIYHGHKMCIVGMLVVKRIISVAPEHGRRVGDLCQRKPLVLAPNLELSDALNQFQLGRSHLALVCEYPEEATFPLDGERHGLIGIVTLEDVLEELIQEDIEDESDVAFHIFSQPVNSTIAVQKALLKWKAKLNPIPMQRSRPASLAGSRLSSVVSRDPILGTSTTSRTRVALAASVQSRDTINGRFLEYDGGGRGRGRAYTHDEDDEHTGLLKGFQH